MGGDVVPEEGCELCLLQVSSRDFFGTADDSEDEQVEKHPPNIAELLPSSSMSGGGAALTSREMSEMLEKIIFEGPESLQDRMRTLCWKYKEQFAESVKAQAAHVPPMTLEIDADRLRQAGKGKKLAPRPQSQDKLAELKKMVEELLKLGVIRVSTSDTASQVLLVAKKGSTKLRFCIDYRAINEATVSPDKWPIPNIKTMLTRLGSKRPKIFGVMDLTSGYHQAPLSEAAKKWTAFVTAFGQFEWNRVAMGLTGAPSYFSRIMMTTVLGDILTKAVEVYLDDFIVFGSTEEEFLENLEAVLLRCKRANITLNPSKCRFGMEKIEYVGHTIDATGTHFSREKIDSVLDMPKPQTKGEMMIFLGMVNYFHNHIAGLSTMEVPLREMIGEKYSRTKRKYGMEWTAEGERAFEMVKAAIDKCPKLFFEDGDLGPVYLQTDASDYGIGAYMFQIAADGSHRPIDFISKTLSSVQRRWGIPDKEAYAIFYAFKKWEHHLRDREFVLQTDHKNLTYVNFEGTAKVKRWKMLIQEFRFKIEYLPGPENVIADSFSRNCAKETTESHGAIGEEFLHFLEDSAQESMPIFAAVAAAGGGSTTISSDVGTPQSIATAVSEWEEEFIHLLEEENELLLVQDDSPIPNDIHEAISSVHNILKGHKGAKVTVQRLREKGYAFKYMRGWAERFILECDYCQKQSYKRSKKETLPFTLAQTQHVMQRLNIDVIGPLDEDDLGFKHILVVIDTFSRWLMAYPLRSLETKEFVRNLIWHIGIFGVPAELLTDGGSTLTSGIVKDVVEMLKVRHKISVAYSHEENAIVERWNHEIVRYLRALVYDANSFSDWSELLPFAQRICNAEVVSSIGVAPAQIIFGSAINLDRAILTTATADASHIEGAHPVMSEYVSALREKQRLAMEYARRIQKEKDDKHMMSSTAPITEFGIGSLVTVSYPANQDGKSKPPSKLLTKRKGPFVILSYDGSTYRVRHLASRTESSVHVSRLEKFSYDAARVDPVAVAGKDLGLFRVEEILDHQPKHHPSRNKSTLKFLVKWKDYGEEFNSWEPWHNLTNNSICLRYCMATHGLLSLVSKKYREALAAGEDVDDMDSD